MSKDPGLSRFTPLLKQLADAPSKGTVTVYVRKGSEEGQRVLTFTIPEGVPPQEIIRRGFAVDGNRAGAVISGFTKVEDGALVNEGPVLKDESGDVVPFEDAPNAYMQLEEKAVHQVFVGLHAAEKLLIDWLSSLGFEVQFK